MYLAHKTLVSYLPLRPHKSPMSQLSAYKIVKVEAFNLEFEILKNINLFIKLCVSEIFV